MKVMFLFQGFILIEVLIAGMILSLIFFSMVHYQTETRRHMRHTYLCNIAITQVNAMLDRLRVNQSASARYRELTQWNVTNRQLLPQGIGSYSCQRFALLRDVNRNKPPRIASSKIFICTVKLTWQERTLQEFALISVL